MDDYAMGLFLAAKRAMENKSAGQPKYLCHALRDTLETEGIEFKMLEPLEIFLQFAATYDGKHFWNGMLIKDDLPRTIENVWWYPSDDPGPRIAMIDFLVGK